MIGKSEANSPPRTQRTSRIVAYRRFSSRCGMTVSTTISYVPGWNGAWPRAVAPKRNQAARQSATLQPVLRDGKAIKVSLFAPFCPEIWGPLPWLPGMSSGLLCLDIRLADHAAVVLDQRVQVRAELSAAAHRGEQPLRGEPGLRLGRVHGVGQPAR